MKLTLDFRCALLGLSATPGADVGGHRQKMASLPSSLPGTRSRSMCRERIPSIISSTTAFLPGLSSARSSPNQGWKSRTSELVRISDALDLPEEIVARLSMSAQ